MKFNGLTFNGLTVTYEPPIVGQVEYTSAGTYYWTVPPFVESISIVAVGGGSAGGYNAVSGGIGGYGGWLAYRNNYTVTAGDVLTIVCGRGGRSAVDGGSAIENGTASTVTINSNTIVNAAPGYTASDPGVSGQVTYTGGGGGGAGGGSGNKYNGGGGGAGGYAGAGGNGVWSLSGSATAGTGGAGGGGRGATNATSGAGGGVGIYGQGSNGAAATALGQGGGGGSGGTSGSNTTAGVYGGGGGGTNVSTWMAGGGGAVRIIYPGDTRYFPSTGTANQ